MNEIEELLKATIQTKVIEAFNEAPEVVEKLVQAALSKEVDEHGGKPGGYGATKMPYMEWLVGNEIRTAVAANVREYVEAHQAEIAARVQTAMESTEFAKPLAEKLAEVMSQAYNWQIDLKISPEN